MARTSNAAFEAVSAAARLIVLLGLGNDAPKGLARAERPPSQAHLPANALQDAQPHLQLLRCLLQTSE